MTTSRITLTPPLRSASTERSTNLFRRLQLLVSDHLPFCVLLFAALFPMFGQLGDDYLWADEGDTAVLAQNILQFGIPKAWDGVTFIDSDMGTRENKDLVMVSHPWLQYYVTAASFGLFGQSAFTARLPFAMAGYMTIIIVYVLIMQATGDRKAALCACTLLVVSVQFLLFSRQCRNYALSMFLTTVLLLLFFNLRNIRAALLFAFGSILAFHAHPSALAPIGACAVMTLFFEPFKQYRRWFWLMVPIIVVCTVPWFFLARAGYNENTTMLKDWSLLAPRLLQFFIECGSVTPVVAMLALFVFLWIKAYRRQLRPDWRSLSFEVFKGTERDLLIAIFCMFGCYSLLIALTISRAELWSVGLRHTTAIIPLTYIVVGILVSKATIRSTTAFLLIILLLSVTKLGRLTPWSFWHEEKVAFDPADIVSMHVPKNWKDRFLRTALPAFSRDLLRSNHGAVANICQFLNTNAQPGEVLITNYEWEPLYFHTKLPQGMKVLPTYPVYDRVQQLGLPYYVYTVKDVRWIVWRWTWGNYRDYDWPSVYQSVIESGGTISKVASIRETAWENQPNIHFHRFPEHDYKFPFYSNLQDVTIFRVDYPWTKNRSAGIVASAD